MVGSIKIISIGWVRTSVRMIMSVPVPDAERVCIVNPETGESHTLEVQGDTVDFSIVNVTNKQGQEMLATGDWQFAVFRDGALEAIALDEALAGHLDSLTRVFPYWNGCYSYTVKWDISVTPDGLLPYMSVAFMKRNDRPERDDAQLESKTGVEYLVRLAQGCAESMLRAVYTCARAVNKPRGTNVLLMSETKRELSGNLLSLEKRLLERAGELNLSVSSSCAPVLNLSYAAALVHWLRLAIKLASQDYVFVDDYSPLFKFLKLRKPTKLIQVWHAGVGFKAVGYARFGKTHSPRALNSAYRNYDTVVVGSTNLIPVYQEVFGLPADRFLPSGLPRIDDFLLAQKSNSYQMEFFDKYPEAIDKQVILFAPTYRGDSQVDAYYPWEVLDWSTIFELCGDTAVWAVKAHPFMAGPFSVPEKYRERIIDVSAEDANDLLHVSDVLVTDYSSIIYEYALLRRPMVFFAFDLVEYELKRGFHGDYHEMVPGVVCKTFDDLVDVLETEAYELNKIDEFISYGFDYVDTEASNRVIDAVVLSKPLP